MVKYLMIDKKYEDVVTHLQQFFEEKDASNMNTESSILKFQLGKALYFLMKSNGTTDDSIRKKQIRSSVAELQNFLNSQREDEEHPNNYQVEAHLILAELYAASGNNELCMQALELLLNKLENDSAHSFNLDECHQHLNLNEVNRIYFDSFIFIESVKVNSSVVENLDVKQLQQFNFSDKFKSLFEKLFGQSFSMICYQNFIDQIPKIISLLRKEKSDPEQSFVVTECTHKNKNVSVQLFIQFDSQRDAGKFKEILNYLMDGENIFVVIHNACIQSVRKLEKQLAKKYNCVYGTAGDKTYDHSLILIKRMSPDDHIIPSMYSGCYYNDVVFYSKHYRIPVRVIYFSSSKNKSCDYSQSIIDISNGVKKQIFPVFIAFLFCNVRAEGNKIFSEFMKSLEQDYNLKCIGVARMNEDLNKHLLFINKGVEDYFDKGRMTSEQKYEPMFFQQLILSIDSEYDSIKFK